MPATPEQISHLLRRTGVRVRPERLSELISLELNAAVDAVCDLSVNPPLTIPAMTASEWEWGNSVRHDWFDRLANLPNPLHAKLVLFWHGHFATALGKVGSFKLMIDQYEKISTHAAGPFETLAQSIAIDPAMLVYLDNQTNTKWSPNENWAREMMELFTLGANRGYTQSDVREVAKAWTGYGIDWTDNGPVFALHPSYHDTGNKTIFGITRAWTGPEVLTEICTGSRQQLCAEFLAAKLWSFFAYEQPDASLVASLAADYIGEGMHTLNFLKRMFKRPEFYSQQAMQGRVKSPIEWCAALVGSLGLQAADLNLGYETATAGQEFLNPPNVAGWKLNQVWINESVLWALDGMARWAAYRAADDTGLNPASRAVLDQVYLQSSADAVASVAAMFGLTLSATTRQALELWLDTLRDGGGWGQGRMLARLMAMSTEARLA